jgi:asparagine synthase (glutamine-hydrolysing)
MCGIAAAIDWAGAEASVNRALAAMVHRGDVSDPVALPRAGVAMATRRLRIVDGPRGAQPKLSSDGRILVCLNGEIYNHIEIRRELEKLGARFGSDSDTEVLANALSLWGPVALAHLEGMYAFVAYDIEAGEFLAARDPFGVKPLYLIERDGGYLFASELRALLNASDFGEAFVLPAGHLLTRKGLVRFQHMSARARCASEDFGVARLDKLMRQAVRSRIPPDLPFAILFSGGLDSTLVAHYARETRPEAPGYLLGDSNAPDYAHAARYADISGLDLRTVAIDGPPQRERLARVVSDLESFEPSVVRDALCNDALFQRISSDGFRVALSGEGADELFAGYVPLEIAFAHGLEAGDYVRDQTIAMMARTNLQRLDRCGLHHLVEAREPLLDSALARYALSLPAEALVEGDGAPIGKKPLRALWDLYPDRLPNTIRERRKVALHVGCGLDTSQKRSPWIDFAESEVSDREFAAGRREFAEYQLESKEEYLYLRLLSESFDVRRVPHLRARATLSFPRIQLSFEAGQRLQDFLAAA